MAVSGAEVLSGGNGNDFVDGNGGADTGIMGRGDDIFVWDPGDGSDIVEGERGSDTMVFNGAAGNEIMAATANSGRVLFTRSPGNIVMDLDGVEVVDEVLQLRGVQRGLEAGDVDLGEFVGSRPSLQAIGDRQHRDRRQRQQQRVTVGRGARGGGGAGMTMGGLSAGSSAAPRSIACPARGTARVWAAALKYVGSRRATMSAV